MFKRRNPTPPTSEPAETNTSAQLVQSGGQPTPDPRLGMAPCDRLGVPAEPMYAALTLEHQPRRVRRETHEASVDTYSPELDATLQERAASEVHAGGIRPLDAEGSWTDQKTLERIGEFETRLAKARLVQAGTEDDLRAAEDAYNALPHPLSRVWRVLIYVGIGLITAVAVVAMEQVLFLAIEQCITRSYIFGLGMSEQLSLDLAREQAWALALLICVPLALTTFTSQGQALRPGFKLGYVLFVELGLSLAFACVRLPEGEISWQFLGWTGFEMGIALAHGLSMFALGRLLAQDSDKQRTKHSAFERVKTAWQRHQDAAQRTDDLENELLAQSRVIELREDEIHRRQEQTRLAEQSVHVAYLHTIQELQHQGAHEPLADELQVLLQTQAPTTNPTCTEAL